jgi:hypothetical protein
VSVEGRTLRELTWMADAIERSWRERFVGLGLLLFGKIKDVGTYINQGRIDGVASQPPPLTPEVARHMKAIEIAGRFVMPDEVERILNGTPAA